MRLVLMKICYQPTTVSQTFKGGQLIVLFLLFCTNEFTYLLLSELPPSDPVFSAFYCLAESAMSFLLRLGAAMSIVFTCIYFPSWDKSKVSRVFYRLERSAYIGLLHLSGVISFQLENESDLCGHNNPNRSPTSKRCALNTMPLIRASS